MKIIHNTVRRKEIMKIRAEKSMKQKRRRPKAVFYEKVNKIYKTPSWTKQKKIKKTQNNNIRNDRSNISADSTNMKRIIRDHCEKLHGNKLNDLDEMVKFFDTKYQNSSKSNNLNSPRSIFKIEFVV